LERAATSPGVTWTPDGHGLAHVPLHDPANIWILPLDGQTPRRLTTFEDKQLFEFGFSADYKQLAVSRGTRSTDLVLIRGLQ
jgi:hypothetical protein